MVSHHWPPGSRSDILDTRLKWLWFPFSHSHFYQQTWLPNANNLDCSKMNLKVTQVYCFKSIYNILHNRLLGEMLSNDRPAVGFGSAQIELRDDGIGGWASFSQSLPIAYLTSWFLAADLLAQEGKREIATREVKSKEWSRWKRPSESFALTRQQQLLQTSFESNKGTINYRNYSCFHWWEIINKTNRLTSAVLYRTIGEGNLI